MSWSREDDFWVWFETNKEAISRAVEDEAIRYEIAKRIKAVHPGLMWEKGTLDDGTEDFVISADGVRDIFPAVHRLADAAPAIPGWQITRFRPIRKPTALTRDGFTLRADEVYVGMMASPEEGPYNIALLVPGLTKENYNKLGAVALVLLDGHFGEEAVVTRLGEIRLHAAPKEPNPHCVPLPRAREPLLGATD